MPTLYTKQAWSTGDTITAALLNHLETQYDCIVSGFSPTGTISPTLGTVTTDTPIINATVTWNEGSTTFNAIKINVTNTASAAASKLIDLQVGGVTQFNVTRAGVGTLAGALAINGALTGATTGAFSSNVTVGGTLGVTGATTLAALAATTGAFSSSVTAVSILAPSNDSGALGASGTAWADLFLASGGVINWNAGNYTITHSAGLLTTNGALTISGALAGVTTITTSGAINGQTISATASFTGTLTTAGALTVNATGSVFSAGTDTDTRLSIGSGGTTPTFGRVVSLRINSPHSGANVGGSVVNFARADSDLWSFGLTGSVSGAKSADTDLGWYDAAGGAHRMALSTSGRLTVAAGFTAQAGHVHVANDYGFFAAAADGTSAGSGLDSDPDNSLRLFANKAERMRIDSSGNVIQAGGKYYLNDSSNVNMTIGLTLNQGANDDEILAFKSSDVAHGITDHTETDTFAWFKKNIGANGGLNLFAATESAVAFQVYGWSTSGDTTKNTGAGGAIKLEASKKSGTSVGVFAADENLLAISEAGSTRYIFDREGSAHADTEWTTYDTHDDLALIAMAEHELLGYETPDQTVRRRHLEDVGIIGRDSWHVENGRVRAMVNFSKLAMLHHGALIQIAERFKAVSDELAALKQHPTLAPA